MKVFSVNNPYTFIYYHDVHNNPIFPGHIEAALRKLQDEMRTLNETIKDTIEGIWRIQTIINKIAALKSQGKANELHLQEEIQLMQKLNNYNEELIKSGFQERRDELYQQICDFMNNYENQKNSGQVPQP